jgi:hypothetical protein
LSRKDPKKTATKKPREQMTRKDPNKMATKKTVGLDEEEGPK